MTNNYEKIPLKTRLVRYLMKNHGWVSGRDLQMLCMKFAGATGKTASRRLQEATEEGLLEVRYIKRAAQYRAKPKPDWKTQHTEMMELWDQTV